jgi:hypothetical protein
VLVSVDADSMSASADSAANSKQKIRATAFQHNVVLRHSSALLFRPKFTKASCDCLRPE